MTKIVNLITISGLAGFILRGLAISGIYAIFFLFTFSHSEEFGYYRNMITRLAIKK